MKRNVSFFIDLLAEMTSREIKARYKNTVFGFLWAFANPLIQMLVIGIIFRHIVRIDDGNYYVFVYAGLVLWNFFSTTLLKTTPSILYDRALIRKARFPYSVIPLSIILSNLIHTLPSIALIIIFSGMLSPDRLQLFIPLTVSILLLLLFTTGMSLFAAAMNVRYRDINFFIQTVLIVWFYATPIIYPVSSLPESLGWLWALNPLATVVQLAQQAAGNSPAPPVIQTSIHAVFIGLVFILGTAIFEKNSTQFDDLI